MHNIFYDEELASSHVKTFLCWFINHLLLSLLKLLLENETNNKRNTNRELEIQLKLV